MLEFPLNPRQPACQVQTTNVDVIANNIGQLNTTAFKRRRHQFADLSI